MNYDDLLINKIKKQKFDRVDLKSDPIKQFTVWFEQINEVDSHYPNAFSLATASVSGNVTSRVMMLRYFDKEGFVFFSGYDTLKASQIYENPNVSMLFQWLVLDRQVKISGSAEKITKSETWQFFRTRSRESQLGAWISQSGEIVNSKAILVGKLQALFQKFQGGQIPLPEKWGGFRVRPKIIEFWQGRPNGLHDRFLYSKFENAEWNIKRLTP